MANNYCSHGFEYGISCIHCDTDVATESQGYFPPKLIPSVRTYTLSIWTGPSTVEYIAEKTGFNAGTERVYAIFTGKGLDREKLVDDFVSAFVDAGLLGFPRLAVRVTEFSEVL